LFSAEDTRQYIATFLSETSFKTRIGSVNLKTASRRTRYGNQTIANMPPGRFVADSLYFCVFREFHIIRCGTLSNKLLAKITMLSANVHIITKFCNTSPHLLWRHLLALALVSREPSRLQLSFPGPADSKMPHTRESKRVLRLEKNPWGESVYRCWSTPAMRIPVSP
jgi:hypothetical protein